MAFNRHFYLLLISFILFFGCAADGDSENEEVPEDKAVPTIIEVTTKSMEFQAPDSMPSGWVTLRYSNNSPMTHFALVDKMPEGKTIKEHQDSIAPFFQNLMDQIIGRPMSDTGVGTNPPAWMSDIVYIGGPGFLSPGQTCEATMYLQPGTYILECYVKTNNIFHTYNPAPGVYGMAHQFIVTDNIPLTGAPEPTVNIEISTQGGLDIKDPVSAGKQTFGVSYLDQKVYPNFVGHDVHLVKREPGAKLDSLLNWIDWMNPIGLESPGPNGFTFLGGIHEMPAGSTGYFTATLEPGEYVFLSEVTRPDTLGLMRVVTVN